MSDGQLQGKLVVEALGPMSTLAQLPSAPGGRPYTAMLGCLEQSLAGLEERNDTQVDVCALHVCWECVPWHTH